MREWQVEIQLQWAGLDVEPRHLFLTIPAPAPLTHKLDCLLLEYELIPRRGLLRW